MAHKAGAFVLFSLLMVGCGVGDEGGGDDTNPDPIDPNPNALMCSDAFKISGTFTPSTARPVDVAGCWPAGTWSFTVTLDPTDEQILDINNDKMPDRCGRVAGTNAATSEANYSFTVVRMDVEAEGAGYLDTYTHNTPGWAANCTVDSNADGNLDMEVSGKCLLNLKVTEGGSRECEGGVELYSADRTEFWNFKPNQATGSTTIEGFGEYAKYVQPQKLL